MQVGVDKELLDEIIDLLGVLAILSPGAAGTCNDVADLIEKATEEAALDEYLLSLSAPTQHHFP